MIMYIIYLIASVLIILSRNVESNDDCPPVPNDCPPDCIKYDEPHCRKCQCSGSKDSGSSGSGMQSPFSATSMGGSPFNQGPSLFQNPYSASMSGGGFQMSPMMAMSGGRSTLPSMFMHGGTLMMGKSSRKCLKNIVCPSYCHEIDEHGCETCPCGPANGINPPGKEDKQKDKQQDKQSDKKDSQCTQTLLCMLSCKDGYELGQKGKDGCQTCKCTKSKGGNSPKQTGQLGNSMMGENSGNGGGGGDGMGGGNGGFDLSGGGGGDSSGLSSNGDSDGPFSGGGSGGFNPLFPGSSMGGGGGGGGGGGSGSKCAGPFCGGGGGGGGMGGMSGGKMVSPFGLAAGMGMGGRGGGGGAGGATVPGRDCFGPECSAKNGMKLVHKENTDKSCPLTDICIKSCRYELKLGKKGNDGCPSCACVKNKGTPNTCDDVIKCMLECDGEYTLSESKDSECPSCTCNTAAVPTLVHKETSTCEDLVVKCMKDCRNGYHLQAVPGRQCPSCKCLPPPPTAAPVPQKTNVYDLLHECPATINCMTNCKSGYDLQTAPGQHCPVCSCNTAVVASLTCVLPLTCRNGCVYGYKRGPDGCPTCSCIEATAVGLSSHTAIYVQSSVSCNAHFSCGSQCEHGYVSGSNKCPSCQCLVPVTVHHTVVPSSAHGHLIAHQTVVPSKEVALSHLSLSSKQTLNVLVRYCPGVAKCVSTCKSGFTLSGAVVGKCPTCLCATVGVATHVVGSAVGGTPVITSGSGGKVHTGTFSSVNVGVGPHYIGNTHYTSNSVHHEISPVKPVNSAHINPPPKETHSQTSEGGSASTGTSSAGSAVVTGTLPSAITGGSGGKLPGLPGGPAGAAHMGSAGSGGGTGKLPGPMHAAASLATSHLGGLSKYPLIPVGHSGVGSECIGPACSAKNGMHGVQEDNPLTPGQCADIMHCVMNCKHGYKLSKGKDNGCPGCQCVTK